MNDISQTLTERCNRYGEFYSHAKITQDIKRAMCQGNWQSLSDDKRECLEMLAHKIGRILNGDPNYHDSWHDIVGYAKLVADRIFMESNPSGERPGSEDDMPLDKDETRVTLTHDEITLPASKPEACLWSVMRGESMSLCWRPSCGGPPMVGCAGPYCPHCGGKVVSTITAPDNEDHLNACADCGSVSCDGSCEPIHHPPAPSWVVRRRP